MPPGYEPPGLHRSPGAFSFHRQQNAAPPNRDAALHFLNYSQVGS